MVSLETNIKLYRLIILNCLALLAKYKTLVDTICELFIIKNINID